MPVNLRSDLRAVRAVLLSLLTLGGGEGACEHGLCDSGDGEPVQATLAVPRCTLLARCVNDNVDQNAGLYVYLCEHLGDFDR